MRPILRPTTEQDAPRLISFLARIFSVPAEAEFLRPDLLHWKLWAPREDYTGPRSYVLERNGEFVGHSGIWPLSLPTEAGILQGCHMFDWAADPSVLGAGVALIRKLAEVFDFIYANGGAEMTQKIIPTVGFQKIGEAWSAVRPFRPVRQTMYSSAKDWRLPARLIRNTLWSMAPIPSPPNAWTLKEGLGETEMQPGPTDGLVCAFRPNGFFRYLQNCPTARIKVFQVQNAGQSVGRVALSVLHHQARVAGVWLNDPSPDGLRAAYRLAVQAARALGSTFEVVAMGNTHNRETAAISAGLRIRNRSAIYWLPGRTKAAPIPFEFQIVDNDAIFLA